jgi:acetoin utilization deacetylase AcuC-like enzyme
MSRTLPVFYDAKMSAFNSSRSPSSMKPKLVVQDWLDRQLAIEISKVNPLDEEHLSLAHSARYVRGVLKGQVENGFGDFSPQIAESLRWTNGSFVSAALHVAANGGFACSPTSGFHHAGYDNGGAFCTFNGLIIAAREVLDTGKAERIGILDLDYHYGDETAEIIDRLQLADIVTQISGWNDWKRCDPSKLLDELPDMIDSLECDILFYQAGADMHIDDPLGGLMTTEQLAERDRIVFQHCARLELPCVWNLAGGYQVESNGGIPKVLEIHRNTLLACLRVAA